MSNNRNSDGTIAVKLTAEKLAEIAALRARDVSRDQIAKQVGLSAGTVSKALRIIAEAQAPKPSEQASEAASEAPALPDEPSGPVEPVTLEGLASDVAGQISELRADRKRARAKGDDATVARCDRHITTLSILAARIAREQPEADGEIRVSLSSIEAAAARAREKILARVERAARERTEREEKQP